MYSVLDTPCSTNAAPQKKNEVPPHGMVLKAWQKHGKKARRGTSTDISRMFYIGSDIAACKVSDER